MKVLNLSTFYAPVVDAITAATHGLCYAETLARFEDALFGSDLLWSAALRRATGWNVQDVVANAATLQGKWRAECHANRPESPSETVAVQARGADVVVLQDVSFLDMSVMWDLSRRHLLAAQVSCPMPARERIALLDLVFTSFPHYVERLLKMGAKRVEFVPLAFEPTIPKRVLGPVGQPARHLDVVFVGGVGANVHWRAGTQALEIIAGDLGEDRFWWWGYGRENLDPASPLHACWHGEAWGRDMYDKLLRAKIVVNRHGEVAEGCGNNLRQAEATGCGACLLTDQNGWLEAGVDCETYHPPLADNPGTIVERARALLADDDRRARIAASGQGEVLARHTYAHRMKSIVSAIEQALAAKRRTT